MCSTKPKDKKVKCPRKICICPHEIQQLCKRRKIESGNDVLAVLKALDFETEMSKNLPDVPPKYKRRKFKIPRYKDEKCVPMTPSMFTRLRYIGHSGPMPPPDPRALKAYEGFDLPSGDDDDPSCVRKTCKRRKMAADKKVRYSTDEASQRCTVVLPLPERMVKHTESDKSMISVKSPNVSGENIAAQKAMVKPSHQKPPLPPKAAIDLIRPHSGIMINTDKAYVPEYGALGGPPISGPSRTSRRRIREVCRKCHRTTKGKRGSRAGAHRRRAGGAGGRGPCRPKKGLARDGALRRRPPRGARDGADDDEGDLDEIPRPEIYQVPPDLKKGMFKTHSLTVVPCNKERTESIHYGILMGSMSMFDNKFGAKSRGKQAVTLSIMAYCLAFHYHPKQWTMKLIDNLLDAGDTWYLQMLEKLHDHAAFQGVCEVVPYGKKQVITLNGKRMQVLLCEPDIVGYTMSKDPDVFNLCKGLRAFFKENRAALLLTRVLKVSIWKDKVCYYIFDAAGRNNKAYSNFVNGAASLINVQDLEHLTEILLGRSIVEDQKFVLAPIKMLKMVDEKDDEEFDSEPELTLTKISQMSYRIINENTALVCANMHLGDRAFEQTKFQQSLAIAVAALTYAKISPPNTWFAKTLDKIIRLGTKLHKDCQPPKALADMTIDNIPNEIILGPFSCEIIIYRERVKGQMFSTKECIFNINTGLEDFFSQYTAGILEFANYFLAVWRQKDMLYLFDPYPRNDDGERSNKGNKGCCFMLLDPDAIAGIVRQNWDYLPATTQFHIHAFKVLKLKKKRAKPELTCTLSDSAMPGAPRSSRRQALPEEGDAGVGRVETAYPVSGQPSSTGHAMGPGGAASRMTAPIDEEMMGDIVSLVDSIQSDFLPPIPPKYKPKNMPIVEPEPKILNLDSPTVSVTQIVPPWPRPRDKSGEPPDEDQEAEITPPPTPPPPPPPEGAEEEAGEEELDEEAVRMREEEERRRLEEEEEARRRAEALPDPMPPPPPSPDPEPVEMPLAVPAGMEEMEILEPVEVKRHILLAEDAKARAKLRAIRHKTTAPLMETSPESPSKERLKPHNFKDLPDTTQIIRGKTAIPMKDGIDQLPFASIMAVILSYKYTINTWTGGLVDFVVETAKKMYGNKKERFQLAPMHVIPKVKIGRQAYQAHVDVVGEGPTWQLEHALVNKFFPRYDRGILTTSTYSCAFFERNGLYYLYDGSCCNPMGLRDPTDKGNACLLRFRSAHELVSRVQYNRDGKTEDQQFILSRLLVRRLLPEARYKLPDDYDFLTGMPKNKKSKAQLASDQPEKKEEKPPEEEEDKEPKSHPVIGYVEAGKDLYKIEGTSALATRAAATGIRSCHFVCLIAMLMAAMHPIRTWDQFKVDTCIEKGLEINEKAKNMDICEKRVIKNINLDGKFIDVNIKKIIVVNENPVKKLDQYLKAVMRRLRYVIVRFPQCSVVICKCDGYYHLFDPYSSNKMKASWTLHPNLDALIKAIKALGVTADTPEFYTFELTSVKNAPRHAAMNYRLSPLFKPDENPNTPFVQRKVKARPPVDEKLYWLCIETIPWSRMNPTNDLGFARHQPKTLWKDWDIEFPGDLYSLWGTLHPSSREFPEAHRGKQYLCVCVVALVMTQACQLSAWTSSFLDGIVINGDKYFEKCIEKLGSVITNHELAVQDLDTSFDKMYPYSFTVKFDEIIFGFVYNYYTDRFNLSKALSLFFEKCTLGLLVSPKKNLAFGRAKTSYFMFDCQSFGAPAFNPGQGAAYILKCESLNRLIYCMTLALNYKRHGEQFHLYNVSVTLNEYK